ncbi:hypothetical protein ACLOAV_007444 [Pseudogymnoascus australis]
MLFVQILVLGSAFAVANAKVIITNSDYSGVTFDQPFTVTWDGATGMVSLLLKNGVPSNQLLVDTIADGLSGNSFTWYPEGDLEEGIYNLEIKDSSGGVNYSPQFRIDHGIDYDHGEGDNDQHHSVAPGHFLNNATDTIATATTAATATTEHAGPASTLVPVHNATVTSSVALNNNTGGTPTNTSVSPPTSSVLTAQAAHHVSPLNGLLFSLLGALALGIAN